MTSRILVDWHVHLYNNYKPSHVLFALDKNYRRALKEINPSQNENICIATVLLDSTTSNSYEFYHTHVNASLEKLHTNVIPLYGVQIKSFEGLEIVVVGQKEELPSKSLLSMKASFEDCLKEIQCLKDVIIIFPWGFGKWIGQRRKLLFNAFKKLEDQFVKFYLGDISQRIACFDKALFASHKILSGSDPLPIKCDERYIASKTSLHEIAKIATNSRELFCLLQESLNDSKPVKSVGSQNSLPVSLKRTLNVIFRKNT
jgi:hypothetical protein